MAIVFPFIGIGIGGGGWFTTKAFEAVGSSILGSILAGGLMTVGQSIATGDWSDFGGRWLHNSLVLGAWSGFALGTSAILAKGAIEVRGLVTQGQVGSSSITDIGGFSWGGTSAWAQAGSMWHEWRHSIQFIGYAFLSGYIGGRIHELGGNDFWSSPYTVQAVGFGVVNDVYWAL